MIGDFDTDQVAGELVSHLVLSRTDAVIVMHRPEEDSDEVVAVLEGEGWTLDRVEYVSGKRIRYMKAPQIRLGQRADDNEGE